MKSQTVLDRIALGADSNMSNQLVLPFESSSHFQKAFRPIHYLGSKLRLVDFIRRTVDSVDSTGGCVCDLFSGSGTVSKYLSNIRPVISVDIQEYARVLSSALLNPPHKSYRFDNFVNLCKKSERLDKLYWAINPLIIYESICIRRALEGTPLSLCELIENGSIIGFERGFGKQCSPDLLKIIKKVGSRLSELKFSQGPEALIVRYYGGLYFSYEQALQLDALLESISKTPKEIRDTLLAVTLSTASDIVNTIGKQFAQPIRPRKSDGSPKKYIGQRVHRDRSTDVFSVFEEWLERYIAQPITKYPHKVYKMDYLDALDLIDEEVKVVYADPPYTRDHYSRFYHVLETICLRDNPEISTTFINRKTNISRGIYRQNRHQSSFCIKSKAVSAFEGLFKKVRELESSLVLSYSPFNKNERARPRLLTIDRLEKIAKKYYKKAKIVSIKNFSHNKLNCLDKNFNISYDSELLIVCEAK
jgi:adenine-specific DNA methylase